MDCEHFILYDGDCASPRIDLTCKGSLGFIEDWFIRPRKGIYLSDYLTKKRIERGLEPPESRDYVRCPKDKEVEDILVQLATFTSVD